jgi:hypothetical protein
MIRVVRSGLGIAILGFLFTHYRYYYLEVSYDFPVYLNPFWGVSKLKCFIENHFVCFRKLIVPCTMDKCVLDVFQAR